MLVVVADRHLEPPPIAVEPLGKVPPGVLGRVSGPPGE
jgi:hypothetical protein